MPQDRILACNRCGKLYTSEERAKNKFCDKCGTYRPKQTAQSVAKKGRKIDHTSAIDIFPYEPYPQQKEFMDDIKGIVGSGGTLIAEACNGFGKTVCALSATLPIGRRIVYATRTHEQASQVMKEIRRINEVSHHRYTAVNIASRSNLCLNERCQQLRPVELVDGCRILRERNECPYGRDSIILSADLPEILSIKGLRDYGFSRGICPYFLARNLVNERDIIVGPYQYFFDELIRSRFGLEISGKILIFDEAHNADKISTEAMSSSLSRRTLEQAEEELRSLNQSTEAIHALKQYLEEKTVEESDRVEIGKNIVDELKGRLGISDIDLFTDAFAESIDEIRRRNMENKLAPGSHLAGIIHFLQRVFSKPAESYVGIFRNTHHESERLDYQCLDASLAIRPVVEETFGTLIMSGTLTPIDFFAEMVGLGSVTMKSYEAIANPEKITAYLDSSVTTKFDKRTPLMLLRYGRRIERFLVENQLGNGALVFFPQRELMKRALDTWQRADLVKHSNNTLFFGDRELFIEGIMTAENHSIVERYKEKARESAAILLGVFRGRNAEGSNFPDEEARTIFLVGIPFADYADPIVKAQIDYFNRKSDHLGERWYVSDAFRSVNQAAGRGIRHREDWCRFVFMDERYEGREKLISPWISAKGFRVT